MKQRFGLILFTTIILAIVTAFGNLQRPRALNESSLLVNSSAVPAPDTIFFTPSSADIPNPERGFHTGVGFTEQSLGWYSAQGYTLAYSTLGKLEAYRDRDLPPEYLNALPAHFQLAREAGIKFIVRFSYNDGPSAPNTQPDATLAQVLRHIEQLAPILEANKDVIAWFEAGFIGAWGEWHSSTNGLDSDANKAIIRDALFANFPADRYILFRYPGDFIGWYPQTLTEAQAFSGTDQARAGHHNDCFLASDSDFGTYYDKNGVLKDVEWKAYIAQMTRFAPMSGETCNPNPPRSSCPTALQEMDMLHWTAQNEAWHPDVIQGWKNQGCYAEIRKRLGYRLTLLEAGYSPTVRAGSEMWAQVKLENTGFASPLGLRPLYVLLIDGNGQPAFQQSLPVDPRRWEAGLHTFDAALALPANLPVGAYQLALWLPDASASLQNDPRYAIRFANENTWDATHGWNVLGTVNVLHAPSDADYLNAITERQPGLISVAGLELAGADSIRLVYGENPFIGLRVYPNQPFVNNGKRAEASFDFPFLQGDTIVYEWKVMFPSVFPPADIPNGQWWSISQWHDQPNINEGETWENFPAHPPAIALEYERVNGQDYLAFYHGTFNTVRVGLIPFTRDEWIKIRAEIHWSQGEDGSAKLYLNDSATPRFFVHGPNMFNNYQHYFKIGQYRDPNINTDNTVYFDDIRIKKVQTLTLRSAAAQDGWILESAETSAAGRWLGATGTLRLGDDAARRQYRSILSFDTQALPDTAVITKVTLKIRRQGIFGGGDPVSAFQGFMADIKRGIFLTANLQAADWQATAHRTLGPFSAPVSGGWYTLDLTPAQAYINKLASYNGLTQIRLRFKLDDNNNAVANYLSLYGGNVGVASRPQLMIEYYVP